MAVPICIYVSPHPLGHFCPLLTERERETRKLKCRMQCTIIKPL